jgi:hypothetical protein
LLSCFLPSPSLSNKEAIKGANAFEPVAHGRAPLYCNLYGAKSMKTHPPAGYERITPLQKEHRVSLPLTGLAPASFARLHTLPLGFSEFAPAGRDYPVAFLRTGEDAFSAIAVLGLQQGQNLFVLSDGSWDRRVYLPSYVRRYPFCMSRIAGEEDSRERVVCVAEDALQDAGEELFDDNGEPLDHWQDLERMIIEFEEDLLRSDRMCLLLAELDLLEPFSMKAEVDGFTLQLEGLFRVAQDKLETSSDEVLHKLFEAGVMDRVYAHLLSQPNFRRLLERRSFFALRPPADRRELN